MTVTAMPRRAASAQSRFTTWSDQDREYPGAEDMTRDMEPPRSSETVRPVPSLVAGAAPAARRAGRGVRSWIKRKGAQARQVVLSVAGLGAFGVAGFEVSPVAGWVVVGLSLLLLEHQVKA